MKILPYKMHSRSARALANELGCRRVRHDSPTFTNRRNHLIVNWGYSHAPNFRVGRYLNHPGAVETASSKLSTFDVLSRNNVPTPEWTTDPHVAVRWLEEGTDVVSRTKLRGHSGDGIHMNISGDGRGLGVAPLYVKYIKKNAEYRYHVFNGEVIDIQMKRKRRSTPNDEVDYQVRNYSNGWVYCRDNIYPSSTLATMAVAAVESLGLDFGAVDIIWNERRGRGYVLEVNTACGLEGTTLEVYANAIRRYNNDYRRTY